jgi:hypothetical protein
MIPHFSPYAGDSIRTDGLAFGIGSYFHSKRFEGKVLKAFFHDELIVEALGLVFLFHFLKLFQALVNVSLWGLKVKGLKKITRAGFQGFDDRKKDRQGGHRPAVLNFRDQALTHTG